MFTLVIMGGTLLSIDNFLFTLFYAVILNITLNFQFFSMHCCADDASRVCRMLDENARCPAFFSQKLNMSAHPPDFLNLYYLNLHYRINRICIL